MGEFEVQTIKNVTLVEFSIQAIPLHLAPGEIRKSKVMDGVKGLCEETNCVILRMS